MTREEAIEVLENGAWWDMVRILLPCDSTASSVLHDAVDMAIAALCAQQEPNAPLTLEELREIGLMEWLWVEVIRPPKRHRIRKAGSAYYQIYEDYTAGEALCCGWPGTIYEFEYEDYGKIWLAYRRKPEEGAIW